MGTIFINGVVLLTIIDNTIKLISSVYVINRSHEKYYRALGLVLCRYNVAGFPRLKVHCDGKYKAIMDRGEDDLNITLECVRRRENVPEEEKN